MKKLRLLLLWFLATLSISVNAIIKEGSCGNNVTFVLEDDGTLVISGTGEMKDFSFMENWTWYSNRNGILKVIINEGVTSIGSLAFYGCSKLTSVTIPNSITNIGSSAFSDCSSLTSVTIPNSVTNIEGTVFRDCFSLTSVTIPNSVKDIGYGAFSGCSSLSSITIPNSVTNIGYEAFSNCSNLTSVIIPNSVKDIGDGAFSGCSNLPIEDGLRYADTYLVESVNKDITTCVIKESTKWIGEKAFYGCSKLTSVTIPNSVTKIRDWTFRDCSSLTSVTIPNSVTSIGELAFYGCSSLTTVNIPNTVTSIGIYAFDGCSSLPIEGCLRYADTYLVEVVDKDITTCVIKEGTKWIGEKAFQNCKRLLTSFTIPNSVISIGNYAFMGCSGLTSVTIPNSVTNIGDYAFYGCDGLTSMTIPNSVTNIRDRTFSGCSSLTSVSIPNSVTNIGDDAFSGCSGLKEVHCKSITPPSIYERFAFENVNTNYCKLYVPIGSKEDYAYAQGWRLFSNIIEENIISDGDNKCAAPSIAFEDGQLKFTSETPNAKFLYTITDTDIKTSLESCEDGNVKLSATYLITAYAEAEGYSTSNATTATLVWLDARLDGTSTDAKEITVNAKPLLITQNAGIVTISGLQDGEKVSAYDASGKQIATSKAIGAETMIDLSSQQGKAAIINVGGKSVNVVIK